MKRTEDIQVVMSDNAGRVEIRQGDALPLHDKKPVRICGNIDSVSRWLEKRAFDTPHACHILVDRDEMSIRLIIDENDELFDSVKGALVLDPAFKKFGINSGEYLTNFEMADLIKMNRSFFENKDVAMRLVSQLRNFKAKVDKDIENSADGRGNRKLLLNQVVESNLPENFRLVCPVFKGEHVINFEVEVEVRPDDLCCTLISPEVNDFINEMKNVIIDEQITKISAVAPDIVIIEL